MKVYHNHKEIPPLEHWCVQFLYRGHQISIAHGELVIFPEKGESPEALREWDGNVFMLYVSGASAGREIRRAMDFIDFTLRNEQ